MWQFCITAPYRIMSLFCCSRGMCCLCLQKFGCHEDTGSTSLYNQLTVPHCTITQNTIIWATPTTKASKVTSVISIACTCHSSIWMAESNCTSRVSRLSCCVSGLWMLTLAVCAGSLLMSSRCLRSLSHSFLNSVLRLYFRQKENACNTHNSSMAHQLKGAAATVELSNRSVQNIPRSAKQDFLFLLQI